MTPGPLTSLPMKELRSRGAYFTLIGGVGLGSTVHGLLSTGSYYPVAMLFSAIFLPMGLWMIIFLGEVDATTGRRSKKWELGFNLCVTAGLFAGLLAFYRLGGLAFAGLSP